MPYATATPQTAAAPVMKLRASVPESAMTAELLGTDREGLAIRFRDDGLAVTVGYLCLEASELWLSSDNGETAPAHLIAQDVESGLALVRPDISIGSAIYRFGDGATSAGQSVRVVNGPGDPALSCNVFAVGEFAGRWEYLIDEAIYTVPACDNWSGAALMDMHGGLIGVGSLFLELPGGGGKPVYGNLFVPVSLIAPHIDDLCLHGTRRTAPIPWMGWMVQEHKGALLVVGIYPGGPAGRAGVRIEDVVTAVNGAAVASMSELFRTVRAAGAAGCEVVATIRNDAGARDVRVQTTDRNAFFQALESGPIN